MNLQDNFVRPRGSVIIRPWDSITKASLKDPLSIFADSRELAGYGYRLHPTGEVEIGDNLVVDGGRQIIANLIGGRDYSDTTPSNEWIVSKISFGTYDEAPRFTDASLSPQGTGANEIEVSPDVFKKDIETVDWPEPFIVRFEGLLEPSEANGYLIRELGLWAGQTSYTLFARKTLPGINKDSSFGVSILWRVRC